MFTCTTIVHSSYYDSVVLMRVASQLKKEEGIREVAMFMGTEGNHALLKQVGLDTTESVQAGPQDLIVIVKADEQQLCDSISKEAIALLSSRRTNEQQDTEYRPRTLDKALGFLPDASIAAISIPGAYAAREAEKCLDHNLSVFLFSDNVSVEDEKRLKTKAVDRNLLFMGSDCGTAYINGIGLGFANTIKSGRIGCIAASGTGLQALACLLDRQKEGLSQGIGVGGRDLSGDVGGIMTKYALELLDQDPATEIIVILSKPPHPDVAIQLQQTCRTLKTPVVAYFQGIALDDDSYIQVRTIDEAAERAIALVKKEPYKDILFGQPEKIRTQLARLPDIQPNKRVVALFTGGTLAKEVQLLLSDLLGETDYTLTGSAKHKVADLGDDHYTVGRPHPMIAPENRTEVLLGLANEGVLDNCAILLFDLVLGNASHHDPATELAGSLLALQQTYGLKIPAVVALIGTEKDPQNMAKQKQIMEDCGASVFLSNREATYFAAMYVNPEINTGLGDKQR